MSLVGQWQAIERDLPEGWDEARIRLDLAEEGDSERAAALLGPASPGRRGPVISFTVARRHWPSPEVAARLLGLLDRKGIQGELHVVASTEAPAAPAPVSVSASASAEQKTLLAAWEDELAVLPSDWSDLYAEVELDSSDYLDRAALLLAPLNPSRYGEQAGFRFRAARQFGYGASGQMAQRCLDAARRGGHSRLDQRAVGPVRHAARPDAGTRLVLGRQERLSLSRAPRSAPSRPPWRRESSP